MLFKQWNDAPAPRHALVDNEDENPDFPIPTIQIQIGEKARDFDYILVIPSTLSPIVDSINKSTLIGNLVVDYPQSRDIEKDVEEEEYDEDEQLYRAVQHRIANDMFESMQLPIYGFGKQSLSITVPYFSNALIYNLIARELVEELDSRVSKSWIILSPCELGFDKTVCNLEVNSNFSSEILKSIPPLNPPHYLTGIAASVCSALSLKKNSKIVALALKAEGLSGFEKVDSDSFVDTAYALKSVISEIEEDFIKKVSKIVRQLNSSSYSGMYI